MPPLENIFERELWEVWAPAGEPNSWKSNQKEWITPSGTIKPMFGWLLIIFLHDHLLLGYYFLIIDVFSSLCGNLIPLVFIVSCFSIVFFLITTKGLHTPLWDKASGAHENLSDSVQWDLFPSKCHANLTKTMGILQKYMRKACCITKNN